MIFANGVTDPGLPQDEIFFSNVEFPQRVIEATLRQGDFRYLTLGTVLEHFPEACAHNPYLRSKLELGHWIAEAAARPGAAGRLLHLRLHTLYGGPPKPHMFLGQIAKALEENSLFRMSHGDQLREYHHVDDIARALVAILGREWCFGPLLEIHSGQPVRLVDLARGIFRAFGKEDLLRVGETPEALGENRDRVFPRSEAWLLPAFREPILGVIEFLRGVVSPAKAP